MVSAWSQPLVTVIPASGLSPGCKPPLASAPPPASASIHASGWLKSHHTAGPLSDSLRLRSHQLDSGWSEFTPCSACVLSSSTGRPALGGSGSGVTMVGPWETTEASHSSSESGGLGGRLWPARGGLTAPRDGWRPWLRAAGMGTERASAGASGSLPLWASRAWTALGRKRCHQWGQGWGGQTPCRSPQP